MKLVIAIPSRYSSKRFPGKPLAILKGKTMIEWVYIKAEKVREILENFFESIEIIIATDDDRIKEACEKFNARVIKTHPSIPSGTDRIYYVTKSMDYDYIVNLQGDEPTIFENDLVRLIEETVKNGYPSATLVKRTSEGIDSPDTVKVVIDREGKALYFSRTKIPFGRDFNPPFYLKHIGVYIYRKDILEKFVNLKEGYLESIEKLEQLRLLENGVPVYCIFAERDTVPVDRREDIEKAEKFL